MSWKELIQKDERGKRAFMKAAKEERPDHLKAILAAMSVKAPSGLELSDCLNGRGRYLSMRRWVLIKTAKRGYTEHAIALIKAGCSVMQEDETGKHKTCLWHAARNKHSDFILKVLDCIKSTNQIDAMKLFILNIGAIAKYTPEVIEDLYAKMNPMERLNFLMSKAKHKDLVIHKLAEYNEVALEKMLNDMLPDDKAHLLMIKGEKKTVKEMLTGGLKPALESGKSQAEKAEILRKAELNKGSRKDFERVLADYGTTADLIALLKMENEGSGDPLAINLADSGDLVRFLSRFFKEELAVLMEISDKEGAPLWEHICTNGYYMSLFSFYETGAEKIAFLQKENKEGRSLLEILECDDVLMDSVLLSCSYEEKKALLSLRYQERRLSSFLWGRRGFLIRNLLNGLTFEEKLGILEVGGDEKEGIHHYMTSDEFYTEEGDREEDLKDFIQKIAAKTDEEKQCLLRLADKQDWHFKEELKRLLSSDSDIAGDSSDIDLDTADEQLDTADEQNTDSDTEDESDAKRQKT